jgi:putative hemolysin
MLLVELAVVLFLIVVNGLLAMSELAIISSRQSRLKAMVEREVHGARRALALATDPGRFLSTVQFGITLVGVLAGAFSGATIGSRLSEWLIARGMPEGISDPLAIGAVVTAITYLSLIIGELVPKRIALRNPEVVACAVAPGMMVLSRVAAPFVWLLDASSRIVLLVLGLSEGRRGKVTDEEIRLLVAEAESAGVLEPGERAMISGVMRLGDRTAKAVMTPRPEVDYINLADDDATIMRTIAESVHSRLPACERSLDDVIGVVQAKELLDAHLRGEPLKVRDFVRPAPVIPDTMPALDVIERLKQSPVHMGLVHDEYGDFEGVLTSADILEAIAGEFLTEEGPPEKEFVRRADGSYLIVGSMPADELAELINIKLPEARSYNTVAGLVLAGLGHLPQVGEIVDLHGWRFEVVDLDGRRIDKVLVGKTPRQRRKAA